MGVPVWSLVLALGASWQVAAPVPKESDRTDTQAKEVAQQFLKALKAEDVKAVMGVADLPFFWDGVKIIKDRKELEAAFVEVFRNEVLTDLEYTIKELYPATKLPELVSKRHKELAEKFAGGADRVVVVKLKKDGMGVLVRIRDGKAKVSGLID